MMWEGFGAAGFVLPNYELSRYIGEDLDLMGVDRAINGSGH